METENLLQELAKPFPPSAITWKPGHTMKDNSKCLAMAYADLRAYQDRLDQVCGLDWSIRYEPWGDRRLMAYLTIAGVTRCSTGEMAEQDIKNGMGGTVAEAQAFKRAAAMFNLGRYLYDLPSVWVEFDAQAKRISKAGQAELDKRYADWYRRATGQPAPDPAPVAAHTNGKPAKPAQKAPETQNGHEADNPWESDENASLGRLIKLGQQVYGDGWDAKAPVLAEHATTGKTKNLAELSEAERKLLIGGLEKKLAAAEKQTEAA